MHSLGGLRRWAGAAAVVLGSAFVMVGSAPHARAAFTGANGKIAFQREVVCPNDPNQGCTHIWTMNPDGSGESDLEPSATVNDFDPAWSPDSTKLALASSEGLTVMNADGTGRRTVSDIASPYQISWSPASIGKIAFSDNCCGTSGDLHTVNVDGTGLTDLTNAGINTDPAWQPTTGALIAFASDGGGVNSGPGIYVMNPNNPAAATRIVAEPANWPVWTASPDWSPDGTQLVFDAADGNDINHIYVVNADGSNPHVVATPTLDPDFFHPHWSPDGTKITFDADGPHTVDVFVMDANGANVVDITNYPDTVAAQYPAWGSSAATGGGGGATTTTAPRATTTTAPGVTTTTTTPRATTTTQPSSAATTTTTTRATTTVPPTTTSSVVETNCSTAVLGASAQSVAAGGQETLTGLCFDPNQAATLSISNPSGSFDPVGSVSTDPDGRFAVNVVVPAGTTNGIHLFRAATSSRRATAAINVTGGVAAPAASAGGSPDPPKVLGFAVTGRDSRELFALGLALIFAGIVLVAGRRIAEIPIEL